MAPRTAVGPGMALLRGTFVLVLLALALQLMPAAEAHIPAPPRIYSPPLPFCFDVDECLAWEAEAEDYAFDTEEAWVDWTFYAVSHLVFEYTPAAAAMRTATD